SSSADKIWSPPALVTWSRSLPEPCTVSLWLEMDHLSSTRLFSNPASARMVSLPASRHVRATFMSSILKPTSRIHFGQGYPCTSERQGSSSLIIPVPRLITNSIVSLRSDGVPPPIFTAAFSALQTELKPVETSSQNRNLTGDFL